MIKVTGMPNRPPARLTKLLVVEELIEGTAPCELVLRVTVVQDVKVEMWGIDGAMT